MNNHLQNLNAVYFLYVKHCQYFKHISEVKTLKK